MKYPGRTMLAAILIAIPVAAAEVDGAAPLLTLSDAVEIALQGNHTLGAADAGLAAAEATVGESRSGRLPDIDIMEAFSRTTNPVFVFGNKLGQGTFTVDDFNPDTLNNPPALNNWHTTLAVTMPVYTGGRVKKGIDAAELQRDAVAAGRERTRQEVVARVLEAYTGAVLTRSHLDVARESLATTRENLRLVNDLYEGGLVVESDVLQARVRESEVEEMVIRAESAVAIAHAALNLVLGRDLDTAFRLTALPVVESAGDRPLPVLVAEATTNRPDLRAADRRIQAAERAVRVEKAGRLPEIGVAGLAEANSANLFGSYGTNWSVFGVLKYRMFDGKATRGRVHTAQARVEEARRMRDLLEQSIGLEVRHTYLDLDSARKTRERTALAVDLSRESLRIVQDRYREGLTNLVELLDAENTLTRARTREVASHREVVMAEASLKLAVGRL